MRIQAYIIHLQRAVGRRENVQRLTENLNVPTTVITAVDSQSLSSETLDAHVRRNVVSPHYPFSLSRNEIACFLSHRLAWSAIVSDNVDAGFVLEDDATTTSEFPGAFAFACDVIRNGNFIRFPHRSDREDGTTLLQNDNHSLFEPTPVGLGMVAQLVTRGAAMRLLASTEQFDRPVDTFAQMHWITGVRPYSIRPSGICENSKDLGGSMLKQRKNLTARIRHEVLRPIYRRKIRQLSFKE